MDIKDGILCDLQGREVLTWCKDTDMRNSDEIFTMLKEWATLKGIEEEVMMQVDKKEDWYEFYLLIK